MPDPGLPVRAAADRVITHHVLDDLTELERTPSRYATA